jgi:hypothetical protein
MTDNQLIFPSAVCPELQEKRACISGVQCIVTRKSGREDHLFEVVQDLMTAKIIKIISNGKKRE